MKIQRTPSRFIREYIRGYENRGKPRLKARKCAGDRWEVGYGSTYYPNGKLVKKGDTITPEMADVMMAHCLATEVRPVLNALNFEPNQYQYDALCSFAYNVGGAAAAGSSVVTLMNEGRFEDAAAAFSKWTGATSRSPTDEEQTWTRLKDIMAYSDTRDRWVWVSPDGLSCAYFQRLRGLLVRHLGEGCISLGFDPVEACADDAVFMRTQRTWGVIRGEKMWVDDIKVATTFKEVERIAKSLDAAGNYKYKLTYADDVAQVTLPEVAPDGKAIIVKKKVVEKPLDYKVDATQKPKDMGDSERGVGFAFQSAGKAFFRLGKRGTFGTGVLSAVELIEGDPELKKALIAFIAVTGVTAFAWLAMKYGEWKRKRGERTSSQPLG